MKEVTFDIYPYPAFYPYYHQENNEVVVVDMLRAGTSMVAAFNRGAKKVIPVVTTKGTGSFLGKGYMVAAERDAIYRPWADLGNDPSELTAERIGGRGIVFTTTNGTQAIHAAREASAAGIIVGAFNNLIAVARHCQAPGRAVTTLASDWQNGFCIEDTLYGAALLDKLEELNTTYRLTDSSRTALELYRQHRAHLCDYLYNCDHSQRLIQRSYPGSLRLCLEQNYLIHIPTLNEAGQLYV